MPNNLQKIKDNIRPGDILLSRKPGSPISETIRGITRSKWSHSFLYLGDGKIIDDLSDGVQIRKLDAYFNGDFELGLFRVTPDLTQEELQSLSLTIRKKIGLKYSWIKLLWLGLLHLLGKSEDPDWALPLKQGVICSELIAWAYLKIGRPLKDLPPEIMEPVDLDESKVTIRLA